MRMLIVDDSKFMREFVRLHTAHLCFETEQAADGLEALDKLQSSAPFDVVMIDWDMPRMDGMELLESLRQNSRFNDVKVIMLTAHTSWSDVSRALSQGADDYLMKPITPDMLADKLRIVGLVD